MRECGISFQIDILDVDVSCAGMVYLTAQMRTLLGGCTCIVFRSLQESKGLIAAVATVKCASA